MINASTNDTTKVAITTVDNSEKKSPARPSTIKKKLNATMVVKIAENTAGITSIVPSTAARMAFLPFS